MALFNSPTYRYSGNPVSQALAAKSYQSNRQAEAAENAAMYGAQGNWMASKEAAQGQRDATLYQQPAQFAGVLGGLYGANAGAQVGALGAYSNPYAQATQAMLGGQASLGNAAAGLAGQGVGAMGGMGAAAMSGLGGIGSSVANATGQLGSAATAALGNMYGSSNPAMANAFGSAMQGLSARDAAAANAVGNLYGARASLGAANQSALGGLGAAQAASLANQSIAAANAYGQMAAANSNMQGQLGNSLAAAAAADSAARGNAAAAQQAAGPQYAKLGVLSGVLPQILDTLRTGLPSSGYGGDIGFTASGPGGLIAAGYGGGDMPAAGDGSASLQSSAQPLSVPAFAPPALPEFNGAQTTRSFMDSLLDRNDRSDSQAGMLRADLGRQFDANRAATTDRSVLDSLTANMNTGYDQLDAGDIARALPRGGYDPSSAFAAMSGNNAAGSNAIFQALSSGMSGLGGLMGEAGSQMGGAMKSAAGYINPMLADGAGQIQSMADRMGGSFSTFGGGLRNAYDGTQAGLQGNYQQAFGGVNDLWQNTLGRNRQFMSAADQARDDVEAGGVRQDAADAGRIRGATRVQADRDTAKRAWWASMDPARRQVYLGPQSTLSPADRQFYASL